MLLNILVRPLIVASFLFLLAGCGSGGSSTGNSTTNSTTNSTNSSNTSNGIDLSKNYGYNPTVAASVVNDHVNVYVAWEGLFRGNPFIFFTRSTNGGQTFEDPRRLFPAIPEGSHPVLAAAGRNVFLVWTDSPGLGTSEVKFSYSDQEGQFSLAQGDTFKPPTRIDLGSRSLNPTMAVSQTQTQTAIYVAWLDQGNTDSNILFRRSFNFFDDLAQNPIQPLSQNGAATGRSSIAVQFDDAAQKDSVYVAWQDSLDRVSNPNATELEDILFVRSSNQGEGFSAPENRSLNSTNSVHPTVAAVGKTVYLLWEDFSSNNSSILAFRQSSDRGITFPILNNREIQLSGVTATGPRMAADGNHIFIVWDNPSPNVNPDQEGSLQILFARSDDQGNRFGIPLNISQNPTSAKNPAITAASGQAFVVWEGQQDSQQKIFFYKPQIN